jgi:hypothetical protein
VANAKGGLSLHTAMDHQMSMIYRNRRTGYYPLGVLKRQTLKQPKLAQLDMVLYKWFTAMHSKGKPMTGPMIIEKASLFLMKLK